MAFECTKSDVGVWMADESRCESVARMIAIDAMVAIGVSPDDFRTRDEIIVAIAKRVDGVLDYVATNAAPPRQWTAEDVSGAQERAISQCAGVAKSHKEMIAAAANIMRVPKPQPAVAVDVDRLAKAIDSDLRNSTLDQSSTKIIADTLRRELSQSTIPPASEDQIGRVLWEADSILDHCRDQSGWRIEAIRKSAEKITKAFSGSQPTAEGPGGGA